MHFRDDGDHHLQQQHHHHHHNEHHRRDNQHPRQDNGHPAPTAWWVTYLLQRPGNFGWQRHKSRHEASLDAASKCLHVTDVATSRLQVCVFIPPSPSSRGYIYLVRQIFRQPPLLPSSSILSFIHTHHTIPYHTSVDRLVVQRCRHFFKNVRHLFPAQGVGLIGCKHAFLGLPTGVMGARTECALRATDQKSQKTELDR